MPDPTHDTQPEPPAQDDQPSEELALPRWRQWNTPSNWLIAGFVVLAALPAVRMVNLVRQATATQYSDYWPMFSSVFNFDGSLNVRGIFEFRNVHSLVTAKLLYWINFQISGGSNNILGYIVVAFVVAQVVLVFFLVRRSHDASIWTQGAIVVFASVLLFARHGTWNFVHAMSGAAWLTANFFVVAAVVAEGASSKRRFGAVALGIAASLSYGTGLMVWPALFVAATARDRKFWRHWPIVVGGIASLLWYQIQPLTQGTIRHGGDRELDVTRFLTVIGASVARGSAGLAQLVAVVVVVSGFAAGVVLYRRAPERAAPWLGLFAYGLLASSFIALGRTITPDRLAQIGRYSSLGTFAIVAAVAMVLLVVPQTTRARWGLMALCFIAALVVWQGDGAVARQQVASGAKWDSLAIVQRLHLADGTKKWLLFERFPPITNQMENMGHYPFNDNFTLGCGLLGKPFGNRHVERAFPQGMLGHVNPGEELPSIPGSWHTSGWLSENPACIVVTNAQGKVVGIGNSSPTQNAKYLKASSDAVQLSVYARKSENPEHVLVKRKGDKGWVEVHELSWYQQNR